MKKVCALAALWALILVEGVSALSQQQKNTIFIAAGVVFSIILIIVLIIAIKRHRAKTPHDKHIDELHSHMRRLSGHGLSDNEIKTKLMNAGWDEKHVDLVIADVHKPSSSIEKLQDYANKQLMKGKTKEEIKETLMDRKWPEPLIDVVLALDEEEKTL